MTSPTLNALIVGTALLVSAAPAAAAPEWGQRVVGTVGQYIAAQGNEALKQIRAEVRRDLQVKLQPVSIERPRQAAAVPPTGISASMDALKAR